MNQVQTGLVHLLDCALHAREPQAQYFAGMDWDALYLLAQQHKIPALVFDTVCVLPESVQPSGEVLVSWQERTMRTMMQQMQFVAQLHVLLAAFDAAGLQVVVLKGVALKALYPQPDLRTMSDADLLIAPENASAGDAILVQEGFVRDDADTTEEVHVYAHEVGLRIELHLRLFDQKEQGFLSQLDETRLFPLRDAVIMEVYEGQAWCFPPLEHALFMLCHMAKHMIVTGFGLRQLCDFVLFTQANAEKIDWRIFWQETESLGLASFMRAVLEIGVRYLSLPDGAWTQGAPCADVDAAELLLADLLDAGVFGNRTQERERSAAVVYRAFNEQGDGWWHRIRRALFVTSDELRPPYLYAKRHRWLLPVAWIHRMGRYGAALLCGKRVHTELTEGMQIADARLGLLHRLGMREKKTKGMKENGL